MPDRKIKKPTLHVPKDLVDKQNQRVLKILKEEEKKKEKILILKNQIDRESISLERKFIALLNYFTDSLQLERYVKVINSMIIKYQTITNIYRKKILIELANKYFNRNEYLDIKNNIPALFTYINNAEKDILHNLSRNGYIPPEFVGITYDSYTFPIFSRESIIKKLQLTRRGGSIKKTGLESKKKTSFKKMQLVSKRKKMLK